MGNDHEDAAELPSGLLTFVFTDIEASTRLYKTLGEQAAGDVFERHNVLLRAAWRARRGHEVHTEGDSFFVVFEDADDAVDACLDVQRRIAAAAWPDGGEVRVRIGMHCGLAAPRDGDYMALSVHQAARVMSAANGGQILVTDDVLERLTDRSARCATACGAFRLRDFETPPVLHRIDDPMGGSASDERPPRAVPADNHNLVPRLTSFVGRDADIVAVNDLIEAGRAVTVVGLGGMGKTRLATEIGLAMTPSFPDGVWMVELAGVLDPELIADEIAQAIGAPTSAGDRRRDVAEFIGDKAMLLIIDNVEHVVDAVAGFLPELLRTCSNCAVLCTSREPVNCPGEFVYRLQPLAVGPEHIHEGEADIAEAPGIADLPSVRLFLDRAGAAAPQRSFDSGAVAEIADICAHLDGLPLAIEVAAAQVGILRTTEILDGLSNRFRLLRSRDRALPVRQRTMEGLLGWSYRLLGHDEQRAFRRLAVFAGSFSIEAAEAALAGDGIDADHVPELIWTLVDKSLISADLSESSTRYRLFESVQQYALRLLIDNDDPVQCAVALADWMLERVGPWHVNDRRWLGEVAVEAANIRNVVDLIADAEPEKAQQLMCSLGQYHDSVQSYQAGIESLKRALEIVRHPSSSQVALEVVLAELHLRTGEVDLATRCLNAARRIAEDHGVPEWDDIALDRLAGEIAMRSGDYDNAATIAEETLTRAISEIGSARMWSLLGIAQCTLGDLARGRHSLLRALAIYDSLHAVSHSGVAHGNIAEAAWRLGDTAAAAAHQRACLNDALAIGQPAAVGNSLIMAAHIAASKSEWATAIRLRSSSEVVVASTGHQLYDDDQRAFDEMTERARLEIGEHAIGMHERHGRRLSIVDAAHLATEVFDQYATATAPPSTGSNELAAASTKGPSHDC